MASDTSVLAQPDVPPEKGGNNEFFIDHTNGRPDRRAAQIREWLLLILRFAITLDPSDEADVLGQADELDALGLHWRPAAPSFFRRTSNEVCHAIAAFDDPRRLAVLKQHLARIDDPRLRRAFEAAVGLEDKPPGSRTKQRALWAGLRR